MEKLTQKWSIVALLEDVEEGYEFDPVDTPMHVTLASVFAVDTTGHELVDGLKSLLTEQGAVNIVADEPAMFGPDGDIAVMKLEKTPELIGLHDTINEWLQELGAIYNSPQHHGQGFAPHSTFQKSGRLESGEERRLRSVSLIDMFPHGDGLRRKLVKTIEFRSN